MTADPHRNQDAINNRVDVTSIELSDEQIAEKIETIMAFDHPGLMHDMDELQLRASTMDEESYRSSISDFQLLILRHFKFRDLRHATDVFWYLSRRRSDRLKT